MNTNKNRVPFIDVAKGVSILLVVLNHSNLSEIYPSLMSSLGYIRLPLFFFISGLFIRATGEFSTFARKKTDTLLKPYFFVLIGIYFLYSLLNRQFLISDFAGIFYGVQTSIEWGPLWYLTHLWLVLLTSYLIIRYTGYSKIPSQYQLIIALFIHISGVYALAAWRIKTEISIDSPMTVLGLPFSLDLLPTTLGYVLAGYSLKAFISDLSKSTLHLLIAAMIFSFTLLVDQSLDLSQRNYPNIFISIPASAIGVYMVLQLALLIGSSSMTSRTLKYIGSSSLFILIFHEPFVRHIYKYAYSYCDIKLIAASASIVVSVLVSILIMKILINTPLRYFFISFKP